MIYLGGSQGIPRYCYCVSSIHLHVSSSLLGQLSRSTILLVFGLRLQSMAHPISSLVRTSLETFNSLLEIIQSEDVQNGPNRDAVALSGLVDELGRLRVWNANIGAHQQDQSSLDYRLRDASHIEKQIVKLFNSLQVLLEEVESVLRDQPEDFEAFDE